MLGLKGRGVHQSSSGWSPVYVDGGAGELGAKAARVSSLERLCGGKQDADFRSLAPLRAGVMSVGFMLPDDDNAVIWRGPRKRFSRVNAHPVREGGPLCSLRAEGDGTFLVFFGRDTPPWGRGREDSRRARGNDLSLSYSFQERSD